MKVLLHSARRCQALLDGTDLHRRHLRDVGHASQLVDEFLDAKRAHAMAKAFSQASVKPRPPQAPTQPVPAVEVVPPGKPTPVE